MKSENEISLTIRIIPSGEDIDISLPLTATAFDIIDALLSEDVVPRIDPNGNQIIYRLSGDRVMDDDETIEDAGLQNGDILIMCPVIVAGGASILKPRRKGKLIYFIPQKIEIGKKERVEVRISKSGLKDYLLKEGIISDSEIKKIEIRKVIKVTITENSIKEGLEIRRITDEEQIITEDNYTEWIFDLIATRIGLASLILNISIVENVKNIGNKSKTVFMFEQEIETVINKRREQNDYKEFDELEEIFSWKEFHNNQLVEFIANNETGKALSLIINHFQKNEEIQSSIILLKSQYNHGKNLSMLNLIEPMKWWMIQSKINYSILELAKDLKKNNPIRFTQYETIETMIKEII